MYLAIFQYMAMQWLTSMKPKSIAISFASALCNDLYIYNETRDYSMKEIMDPMEEEGLFFRNVYFQFMTTMIVGGVWFLICAKDILNLINNHCNKMFSVLVLCHYMWFSNIRPDSDACWVYTSMCHIIISHSSTP